MDREVNAVYKETVEVREFETNRGTLVKFYIWKDEEKDIPKSTTFVR